MRDATVVINREQAEEIARLFFERAPGVVAFNEQTKRTVLAQGFVESPLGRRRRFPQLPFIRDNRAQLNEVFREAINMVTQSAASDATLYSLVTLHQKGYQPMLTVHDSITLLADEHNIEDTVREQMRIMQACAEELYGNSIPLPAEGAYGKRWGSLTEVKK